MPEHVSSPRAALAGSIWGVTTYFNPSRYANKRVNYRRFRESLKAQGLPLVAVELVHGDAPFELHEGDAEILVQRRGGDVMWQKERMLNVGLEHLPSDCDKVVLLDADTLFRNRHWVADTAELLEQYAFVQPFSYAFWLSPQCTTPPERTAVTASVAYCWVHGKNVRRGVPGFALAARREVLQTQGIYDRMILGGGDRILLSAAMGIDPADSPNIKGHPATLLDDARQWCQRISAVAGHQSLGYTEGNLLHLWHGTFRNRRYGRRARLLADFDVHHDIRVDDQGAWVWASNKPALHAGVRRYFELRNEEGSSAMTRWQRWFRSLLARRHAVFS